MKELIYIQNELKAPKGQFNNFGKYNYRSCEDILQAVKALLYDQRCYITLHDDIVAVEGKLYVKATATIYNEAGESLSVCAFAREEQAKKGMDECQMTGAASSYARKYALNGLFAIDNEKDSDATNTHDDKKVPQNSPKRKLSPKQKDAIIKRILDGEAGVIAKAKEIFEISPEEMKELEGFNKVKP